MDNIDKTFISTLSYAINNQNKTCLFITKRQEHIKNLYTLIPESVIPFLTINIGNNVITFNNGSRIIIKSSFIDVDQVIGLEIDIFEEFGFLDFKCYSEIMTRVNRK